MVFTDIGCNMPLCKKATRSLIHFTVLGRLSRKYTLRSWGKILSSVDIYPGSWVVEQVRTRRGTIQIYCAYVPFSCFPSTVKRSSCVFSQKLESLSVLLQSSKMSGTAPGNDTARILAKGGCWDVTRKDCTVFVDVTQELDPETAYAGVAFFDDAILNQ